MHTLMHGVRTGDLVDVPRLDQFDVKGRAARSAISSRSAHCASPASPDLAARVVERRAHRMQAVEPHQAVRRQFRHGGTGPFRGLNAGAPPLFWSRKARRSLA
jgi:hypothetical protein